MHFAYQVPISQRRIHEVGLNQRPTISKTCDNPGCHPVLHMELKHLVAPYRLQNMNSICDRYANYDASSLPSTSSTSNSESMGTNVQQKASRSFKTNDVPSGFHFRSQTTKCVKGI